MVHAELDEHLNSAKVLELLRCQEKAFEEYKKETVARKMLEKISRSFCANRSAVASEVSGTTESRFGRRPDRVTLRRRLWAVCATPREPYAANGRASEAGPPSVPV
jgi:hypothetical protein